MTVKDLGKNLAFFVVIMNCSDQMGITDLNKLFMGLARSGAWGCFDEFNLIVVDMLSVVAQRVQILLDGEAAKSHLYHAATLAARDDDGFEEAVRAAKAHGSAAFAFAGDRAVQFHGGFGFTYECDAQLFLRRALWCQYQFGDERYQRQLLAPIWLDETA